jgi:glycine/D-amino acid oxidase-like deaminating enzyme
MRIAIAGAGFAGLAAAYHLREHDVTLFDPVGIGGGASGVSAGLLHPFAGHSGRMNPRAREGMQESMRLINASEKALGRTVCDRSGIVRMPISDIQKKRYSEMPLLYEGLRWDGKNLHIDHGLTVFPKLYLQGLFQATGATFKQEKFHGDFDHVILAIGAAIVGIDLPIQFVKGQILRMPGQLSQTVLCDGYKAKTEDPNVWNFGATFEHHFSDDKPDMELAKKLLKKKWHYGSFDPIGCDAGVRVVNKRGSYPIIHSQDAKTWVITGMGIRGLLYHALVGKELSRLLS